MDPKTGKVGMILSFKEKEIVRYFDLDKRFLATKDIGLKKKKAVT